MPSSSLAKPAEVPLTYAPHLSELPSVTVNPADGWMAERGQTLHKVLNGLVSSRGS